MMQSSTLRFALCVLHNHNDSHAAELGFTCIPLPLDAADRAPCMMLCHAALVTTCLSFMSCELVDGVSVMTQAPDVVCYSPEHKAYTVAAVVLLVFLTVVVPVGVLVVNHLSVLGDKKTERSTVSKVVHKALGHIGYSLEQMSRDSVLSGLSADLDLTSSTTGTGAGASTGVGPGGGSMPASGRRRVPARRTSLVLVQQVGCLGVGYERVGFSSVLLLSLSVRTGRWLWVAWGWTHRTLAPSLFVRTLTKSCVVGCVVSCRRTAPRCWLSPLSPVRSCQRIGPPQRAADAVTPLAEGSSESPPVPGIRLHRSTATHVGWRPRCS